MIPNPPQQIAFSVEGSYLNVFLQGGFAGQVPLNVAPPDPVVIQDDLGLVIEDSSNLVITS